MKQKPPISPHFSRPPQKPTVLRDSAGEGSAHPSEYRRTLERLIGNLAAIEATFCEEQKNAGDQLTKLLALTPQQRLGQVSVGDDSLSAPLCEALLDRIGTLSASDPVGALELAEAALALACRLDQQRYGSLVTTDLISKAWAHLGNSKRILGDLRGADHGLSTAVRILEDGTGDLADRSRIESLLASLRIDQGRFEEARQLLLGAEEVFRHERQNSDLGRVLLQQARLRGLLDDLDGAIAKLRQATRFLDSGEDPRLLLCAVHNLLWFLTAANRAPEALLWLQRFRSLYERSSDPSILIRLHWLEGRIALELGKDQEAEVSLVKARRGWINLERDGDTALVGLDLAFLLLRQGRIAEVQQLAQKSMSAFLGQDMRQEVFASLVLFHHAAEQGLMTVGLLRELSRVLEHLTQPATCLGCLPTRPNSRFGR